MAGSADDAGIERTLRGIIGDVLALPPARVARFDAATPLFGALPELDSMAAANLLGEIEDRLGILIEDDEIDGETMASFGSLLAFVRAKARG